MSHPAAGVIYLSRDPGEFAFVKEIFSKSNLPVTVHPATMREEFEKLCLDESIVLILSREGVPELGLTTAAKVARQRLPNVSLVALAMKGDVSPMPDSLAAAGYDDLVPLDCAWRLVSAVRRAIVSGRAVAEHTRAKRRDRAMTRLVAAVQELSLARNLATIQMIVRRAARDLTGAQGATFVLRDVDRCYYADEDAIAPLWKGQRFPMSACVSGWVMSNRKPVVIEDVFADPRVPAEAYRPTFVRSMLMVPIRTDSPIGAIGNYWADHRRAEPDEIELLQALANTTAVAMENVSVYDGLEQRVRDRTRLLEETNRELEAFSYSVSHDLRSPLSAILGYADLLRETLSNQSDNDARMACERIIQQTNRMSGLIHDLLRLARISSSQINLQRLNLSAICREVLDRLTEESAGRHVATWVEENLSAHGDAELVHILLDNLISNAWKYTGRTSDAHIEIGAEVQEDGTPVFFVRDNGAGFNPTQTNRLFSPFQRLHHQSEFPGVGVGLATVQRIVHKHGGRVWAKGAVGQGATFYFTLPGAVGRELPLRKTPLALMQAHGIRSA